MGFSPGWMNCPASWTPREFKMREMSWHEFMPELPMNPLGVMPEHFLSMAELDYRVSELAASFDRYALAGRAIPPRRIVELLNRGITNQKIGRLRSGRS